MAKLTNESKVYLKERKKKFKNATELEIAFIGDSHIGQTEYGRKINRKKCQCSGCNEKYYKAMINNINKDKGIISIIHGGDATDNNIEGLRKFKAISREVLNYNSKKSDGSVMPIFTNVGNHDFLHYSLDEYHKEIGNDNYIAELYKNPKYTNHRLAIVMLNTGYGSSGSDVIDSIKKLKRIMKKNKYTKYIIDMHIPGRIKDAGNNLSHYLSISENQYFRKLLTLFRGQIIAIVAHHKHGFIQSKAKYIVGRNYKIPVFITAQGGNCDSIKGKKGAAHYSYYVMKIKNLNRKIELSSVYRYNAIAQGNNIVVEKSNEINF